MVALFQHEMKQNRKNLLIWSLVVGGLGLACILLYSGMQESMAEMAESFSSMGAFADAFGMSTLSLATLTGYFATEIGTIHGLGGGMFAAIVATVMLSKEEDGHTGEFLYSLPISRGKAVTVKALSLALTILLFQVVCGVLYVLGFVILGEDVPWQEFMTFMGMQLVMNLEIAAICFAVSAVSKKNKLGMGLGLALFLYLYDLMARVIPSLEDYIDIGPYSYANASQIFAGNELSAGAVAIGAAVLAIAVVMAYVGYLRRDLAS